MSIEKINPRLAVILLLMIVVAAMRIPDAAQITPWANFSPIGAMGLFGGAYFNSRWKAFAFPLLTLFVSDLIINIFIFDGRYGVMYSGWYVIYGIFALIVFYGKWMIQKVAVKNVLLACIVAAVSHWLLADFTVWLGGGTDLRTMMPLAKNWAGLLQCYAQGVPFMRNFLLSNLVYSGILFGGFELAQRRYPVLKLQMA
ncbi:MAG: hypothetical protein H7334_10210 [Ferruginibacter sp.]|nr:hypothetical protein [Ferruginibacter sp.]